MVTTASELRDLICRQMFENVGATRIIDQARRTPNAAKIGKCIDIEYLHSKLGEMGVRAPRAVVDDLFNTLDPDGDGVVDWHAFLQAICGSKARDFMQLLTNLITSDTIRETKMRRANRRKRIQVWHEFQLLDCP